jgi:hypothetical protein
MKKAMIIWFALFFGLSCQAYAKAGLADDGFEFVSAIVGFLLLVAGFIAGIDFLIKHRKDFVNRLKFFLKKKISSLRNSFSIW